MTASTTTHRATDKTAVVDGDLRFTYRDLQARVNQLSHAMQSLGVETGDRVRYIAMDARRPS